MGNTKKQHGYEMFLYRIRGYVKNVNKSGSKTIFNIEPSSLHISGMQGKDNTYIINTQDRLLLLKDFIKLHQTIQK